MHEPQSHPCDTRVCNAVLRRSLTHFVLSLSCTHTSLSSIMCAGTAYAPLNAHSLASQAKRFALQTIVADEENAGIVQSVFPHHNVISVCTTEDSHDPFLFLYQLREKFPHSRKRKYDTECAGSKGVEEGGQCRLTCSQPVSSNDNGLPSTLSQREKMWELAQEQHDESSLAYVLTTSGTTRAEAALVQVPHSCIVPNVIDFITELRPSPGDGVLLASPLAFDPSVVEMFTALGAGATLVVVGERIRQSPQRLLQVISAAHISIVMATPALIHRLGGAVRERLLAPHSRVRALVLGGEPCPPPSVLRQWWPSSSAATLYNVYGVTEVSCWATMQRINRSLLELCDSHSTPPLSLPPIGNSFLSLPLFSNSQLVIYISTCLSSHLDYAVSRSLFPPSSWHEYCFYLLRAIRPTPFRHACDGA